MPWKRDDNGSFVEVDGNPVWVTDSGEEKGVDYPALSGKLTKTAQENMQRKARVEELEKRYAKLSDKEDLDTWLSDASKAIETVQSLTEKDKEVEDRIRAQVSDATKPLREQLSSKDEALTSLQTKMKSMAKENAANNLPYMQKIALKDTVRSLYVNSLDVDENGVVFVKDENGQPRFNENGDRMTPNEGLMAFVSSHPEGAGWLSGSDKSGGGATPYSAGGSQGAKNPFKKETWNATEQMKLVAENPALAKSLMQSAGYPVPAGM